MNNDLNEQKWFVYIDYTLENIPFYVGKGSYVRTTTIGKRSDLWHRIAKKYGRKRIAAFVTDDESIAFDVEKFFIAECNTFNGWGANFTAGGEGISGLKHTQETKEKLRQLAKNKPAWNKGIPQTDSTKKKLSESVKKTMTPEHRKFLSEYNKKYQFPNRLGSKHTQESLKKMSESHKNHVPWNKGQKQSEVHRLKNSESKKGLKIKFTKEIIEQIYQFNDEGMSSIEIAKQLKASLSGIKKILNKENLILEMIEQK